MWILWVCIVSILIGFPIAAVIYFSRGCDDTDTTTSAPLPIHTDTVTHTVTGSPIHTDTVTRTSTDENCLCVFDFDRTITSAPHEEGRCNSVRNKQGDRVWDHAYGASGPLAFSNGAPAIKEGFCGKCYTGIMSGSANIGNEDQGPDTDTPFKVTKEYIATDKMVNLLGPFDETRRHWNKYPDSKYPDIALEEWKGSSSTSSDVEKTTPFYMNAYAKEDAMKGILSFYNDKMKVSIKPENTYYFGDVADDVGRVSNIEGINSRQISCNSRSAGNDHGHCGMTKGEVMLPTNGVAYCNN